MAGCDGVTYERSAKENVDAIRLLLDLGLDRDAANNEGRTALMGAAGKGRNGVVQLLVIAARSWIPAISAAGIRTV